MSPVLKSRLLLIVSIFLFSEVARFLSSTSALLSPTLSPQSALYVTTRDMWIQSQRDVFTSVTLKLFLFTLHYHRFIFFLLDSNGPTFTLYPTLIRYSFFSPHSLSNFLLLCQSPSTVMSQTMSNTAGWVLGMITLNILQFN